MFDQIIITLGRSDQISLSKLSNIIEYADSKINTFWKYNIEIGLEIN